MRPRSIDHEISWLARVQQLRDFYTGRFALARREDRLSGAVIQWHIERDSAVLSLLSQ